MEKGNARYINEKKSLLWAQSSGVQSSSEALPKKGSYGNYITEKDLIKSETPKFSKTQPSSDFELPEETQMQKQQRLWQDKAGVGKSSISVIEFRGFKTPRKLSIEKIATALNTTLEWLLHGEVKKPVQNALRDMPKVKPVVTVEQAEIDAAIESMTFDDEPVAVKADDVFKSELVDDVIDAEPEQIHSNELAVFNFENHTVRTVIENGEVWFVAKDVTLALGYVNSKIAISQHCEGVQKLAPFKTVSGIQKLRVINEPDLYRLILGSELK